MTRRMPLSSRRNLGSNKPSDSELSSIDKKEISSRQANDRRLSQAINYLVTKGGEDSLAEFKGIVCKIDKYIVQQYVDEGYSFDPELYQQLQIMIEEQLDDFRRSDNRSIHPPSNRGSDSVKEVNYGDTLPRGDSDWDYGFDESLSEITEHLGIENQPTAHSKNATVKPRPFRSETSVLDSSYGTKSALHVERQWRYGGPNNEPEKYHKDHLPILPFSETFYMPESQKSKGDLAKSVSTETTDDPIAHTAVGRSKTEKRLNGTCDLVHESGSQFGLPRIIKRVLKFIPEFLDNAVADFNNGDTEAKIEKDYAPRIFLERIKVHPNHGTRVGKKLGRDTTLHSNNSASGNKPTISKPINKTTRTGPAHATSTSSGRQPVSRKVMVIPKTASPRPNPLPMVPSRPRKNDNRIGYSRGEPTTPTPLTTRSKRKVIGSNIPSPSKKAKTMTKEVAFSKEVHYYDSDESYADPSPSSTKTGVSATKGNQKVTVIRNLALRKKPKKLHSPTLAAASGNSNVNSAADRQDAPKRSSTRSGLKFRK